jgi:dTDP-4-amino-4,6-dideoxygalactose transaminase
LGGNFRFDTLQAAVVNVKFPHLDSWSAGRQANAARYRRLFDEAGLTQSGAVRLPYEAAGVRHIYNQFVIRVSRRDELLEHLKKHDVGCEIYYPVPLHLQECFADYGYREGDLPVSEAAAKETLALPIYPELSDEQAKYVVACIRHFFEG